LAIATVEELITVDEIGEKIAVSVKEFFENQDNIAILERLKKVGIQLEMAETDSSMISNVLEGKIFVVSGVFEKFSRDDLKKTIEDNGGKVGSSISAKTSFVIAGDNMGPAKLEKANQLHIPIITEDEFVVLLQEK